MKEPILKPKLDVFSDVQNLWILSGKKQLCPGSVEEFQYAVYSQTINEAWDYVANDIKESGYLIVSINITAMEADKVLIKEMAGTA